MRVDLRPYLSRCCVLPLTLLALAACQRRGGTPTSAEAMADPAHGAAGGAPAAAGATSSATTMGPQLVVYASDQRRLRGFLARPAGEGPFPAVVFNHGSEKLPGAKDGQVEFYTKHGFVLFVPHRRGHGRSEGAYVMDVVNAAATENRGTALVDQLVEQVDDVAAAVKFVKKQPFVDQARVAVVGCSFGGIESLLAAERDLDIRAAIDFAGAAMAWGDPDNEPLRNRMSAAARQARVPVFLLQAENDFDTRPTTLLSAEMEKAGRPHRSKIFPGNGTSPQEGHAFCNGGAAPPWGPDVLEFLENAMRSH